MKRFLLSAICLSLALGNFAQAGVKSTAVKEAAEYVLRKFGVKAGEETAETLARKLEVLALKHGDEALIAVKKVGPRALRVAEEAGEHSAQAIKLMAKHGDEAAWLVAKSNRMAMVGRYGDDAAAAMIRHGEVAEPLIKSLGQPAAATLKVVTPQNGRRLAMLAEEGTLSKIGRTDKLLAVTGKYGDRALDFVWRNKGALTVATALTAFLANPEPFINGTADITRYAADKVTDKLAEPLAREVAKNSNWTMILSVMAATLGAIVALKMWMRHRLIAATARTVSPS
jgi:hypothetical protein